MRTIVLIALSFFALSTFAQSKGTFNLEAGVFRFAKENGFFTPYYYSPKISVFNKLSLGFSISHSIQLRAGIRNLPKVNNSWEYGESYEATTGRGAELSFGIETEKRITDRLSIFGELGGFYERYKQTGIYWVDYPPTYEINHLRLYKGAYLELKVAYKIRKHIYIVGSVRDRYGCNTLSGTSTNSAYTLFPAKTSNRIVFEVLSNLSVRCQFGAD